MEKKRLGLGLGLLLGLGEKRKKKTNKQRLLVCDTNYIQFFGVFLCFIRV